MVQTLCASVSPESPRKSQKSKNHKNSLIEILTKERYMGEIITTAATCFGITLFGLGLGFVFLQVQANT
jgi:hypothetical protein